MQCLNLNQQHLPSQKPYSSSFTFLGEKLLADTTARAEASINTAFIIAYKLEKLLLKCELKLIDFCFYTSCYLSVNMFTIVITVCLFVQNLNINADIDSEVIGCFSVVIVLFHQEWITSTHSLGDKIIQKIGYLGRKNLLRTGSLNKLFPMKCQIMWRKVPTF